MADFKYQEPFPIQKDCTEYRLLTKRLRKNRRGRRTKNIKNSKRRAWNCWPAKPMPTSLFTYVPAHLQKLADILKDPEATDNDKFVAHTMLIESGRFGGRRTTDLSRYGNSHRYR